MQFFKKTVLIILSVISIVMLLFTSVSCNNTKNNNTSNLVSNKNNQKPKEDYIDLTDEEYDLLTRLVSAEASVCSQECQRDVASVVINRLEDGHWGNTLYEVIYYPNAFSPVSDENFDNEKPTKSVSAAVDFVIKNGPTLPAKVMYFRDNYDFDWEGYKNYKVIDNMYFGYFTNGDW